MTQSGARRSTQPFGSFLAATVTYAVGVLLVAYTFVRLCQYHRHSGSAYASVGAALAVREGINATAPEGVSR